MRHTRAHTGNRRSHHALKNRNLSVCGKCGEPALRHAACLNCGTYRGREAVKVADKISKKAKKSKATEKK